MANELLTKGVDLIWDNWLNSVKALNTVQEDLEKRTVEALNAQKTTFDSTLNAFKSVEAQSTEAMQQWQKQMLSSVEAITTPAQSEQLSSWFDTFKQVTEQTQQLTIKPTKAIADYITKAQAEWEKALQATLNSQKAEREKALRNIEQLTAKLKEDQKSLVGAIPEVPVSAAKAK